MFERSAATPSRQAPRSPRTASRPSTASAGNRAVARCAARAAKLPPGRGATGATARRRLLRAATKVQSYGEFSIDNYDPVDTDKDNDTTKTCGINIDVTYTSPESIRSNKIGFVQMMKCLKGDGTPLLFANEVARATDAKSGDEGWAVDRLKGMKWGYYGMEDTGLAGSNLKLGSRTDKTTSTDAFMHDKIQLGREAGKTAGCTAMTFAIDIEHGNYLGGFSWGYSVSADGKVTANTLGPAVMGKVQYAAIRGWNTQAELKDATKRNAPSQELLPTAEPPVGDFPYDPNAVTRYA